MKVVIFTMQLLWPFHPESGWKEFNLEAVGHEVEICGAPYPKQKCLPLKLLYYLDSSYFRWDLIYLYKAKTIKGDVAIVYDLSLLPLL